LNCAKSAQVALAGLKQIDRSVFREVKLDHAAHQCESIDELASIAYQWLATISKFYADMRNTFVLAAVVCPSQKLYQAK
jgi:tRNA splicing endonuclease